MPKPETRTEFAATLATAIGAQSHPLHVVDVQPAAKGPEDREPPKRRRSSK